MHTPRTRCAPAAAAVSAASEDRSVNTRPAGNKENQQPQDQARKVVLKAKGVTTSRQAPAAAFQQPRSNSTRLGAQSQQRQNEHQVRSSTSTAADPETPHEIEELYSFDLAKVEELVKKEATGGVEDLYAFDMRKVEKALFSDADVFNDADALRNAEHDSCSVAKSECGKLCRQALSADGAAMNQESGPLSPQGKHAAATPPKMESALAEDRPVHDMPVRARRRSAPGPGESMRPKDIEAAAPALGSWQDAGLKQLAAENRELKQRTAQLEGEYERLQRLAMTMECSRHNDEAMRFAEMD